MTIPFYCTLLSFLLIMFPRAFVTRAMADLGGYDNRNPRDQQAKLTGLGRRAHAAHLNSFEAFAPFAAAVLVCHAAHGNERWAAILAVAFVIARLLYIAAYLGDKSTLRSTVWTIGYVCTAGLFILPIFS